MKTQCCALAYWKHEDGWDVYQQKDCQRINGRWIPRWFDNFVMEDAPTKKAAIQAIQELHPLKVCLVR